MKAAFTVSWIIQHAAIFLAEKIPDLLLTNWDRYWLCIYIAIFAGERTIFANDCSLLKFVYFELKDRVCDVARTNITLISRL
jgi:hypothetical protein